jgi:hypothetical protein
MIAGTAGAVQELEGSDTLEFVMRDIITGCEASGNPLWNGSADGVAGLELVILAGGTGAGETAVERNTGEKLGSPIQQLSHMSREFETGAGISLANDACVQSPILGDNNPATNQYAPFPAVNPQQAEVGIDKLLVPMGNCDDGVNNSCPAGEQCRNGICSAACVDDEDCELYKPGSAKQEMECVSGFCEVPVDDALCPLDTLGDVADSKDGWGHAIRVLFFGYEDATNTYNCASPERVALAEACNLYHIYRRDDASGTTSVFKSLLGVPGNTPFCNDPGTNTVGDNSSDNEKNDLDPIRRPCDQNEDVCRCDGTLGLLLPISIPALGPTFPLNVLYPDRPCAAGLRVITNTGGNERDASGNLVVSSPKLGNHCSDGQRRFVNGCIHIVSSSANGLTPACMFTNKKDTAADPQSPLLAALRAVGRTVAAYGPQLGCPTDGVANDERSQNLDVRVPAGVTVQAGVVNTVSGAILGATTGTEWVNHAFYRIHAWDGPDSGNGNVRNYAVSDGAGGTRLADAGCQKLDATIQIGCLVARDAQHNKRSSGFAGLQAVTAAADTAGIDKLADPLSLDTFNYTAGFGQYPFARKLYVNSLVPFASIEENKYGQSGVRGNTSNGDELSLARCIAASDNVASTIVQTAILNNGYDINAGAPNGGAVVTPTTPACGK